MLGVAVALFHEIGVAPQDSMISTTIGVTITTIGVIIKMIGMSSAMIGMTSTMIGNLIIMIRAISNLAFQLMFDRAIGSARIVVITSLRAILHAGNVELQNLVVQTRLAKTTRTLFLSEGFHGPSLRKHLGKIFVSAGKSKN